MIEATLNGVPEGLESMVRLTVWLEPETSEQFETLVLACGGYEAVKWGPSAASYEPSLHFLIDGLNVYLREPKIEAAAGKPKPALRPFMADVAARVEATKEGAAA